MLNFSPYLLFDGNCTEAMRFYYACFGGELTLTKVSDSTIKDQMPKEMQNKVIYGKLKSGVIDFSASDWVHPTRKPKQGNTVCLHIVCETAEELKGYFDKLSEGTDQTVLDPLKEQFFGTYGALTDKYGVRWMFKGDKKIDPNESVNPVDLPRVL
jgi:PhnB protein